MNNRKTNGLEALSLSIQLGLTIALPMVLLTIAGRWIDLRLGTNMIFMILFLIFGIAGGIMGAYKQIMTVTKRKK